ITRAPSSRPYLQGLEHCLTPLATDFRPQESDLDETILRLHVVHDEIYRPVQRRAGIRIRNAEMAGVLRKRLVVRAYEPPSIRLLLPLRRRDNIEVVKFQLAVDIHIHCT